MRRILFNYNLFWLLFSLIICIEAYRLKLGAFNKPGPGFFPFSAGLIMLILSLSALFQSIKKKNNVDKATRQEPFRWWNIVIILTAVTAYAFSLEKIGFLINTFLFMCLLLKVVEPQTWKTAIIGGLITTIAANLIFNVIFRAQIPRGILGF
ncbi:MAG: tripartite tricarboxylate transporter TctB family protein [Thermodesulfobacteriota bacterium]|nr:tripartite tricarboxylate transporter TctB family protein [Thermodesulfobacteriota bacterium]